MRCVDVSLYQWHNVYSAAGGQQPAPPQRCYSSQADARCIAILGARTKICLCSCWGAHRQGSSSLSCCTEFDAGPPAYLLQHHTGLGCHNLTTDARETQTEELCSESNYVERATTFFTPLLLLCFLREIWDTDPRSQSESTGGSQHAGTKHMWQKGAPRDRASRESQALSPQLQWNKRCAHRFSWWFCWECRDFSVTCESFKCPLSLKIPIKSSQPWMHAIASSRTALLVLTRCVYQLPVGEGACTEVSPACCTAAAIIWPRPFSAIFCRHARFVHDHTWWWPFCSSPTKLMAHHIHHKFGNTVMVWGL